MAANTSELVFRAFEPRLDAAAQRELFTLSFPETVGFPASTSEHHQWKFHDFPASPPSYEFVAQLEDGLAGYYAALPYRYSTPYGTATCGMVCDVMTHPRARGKGVFTRLGVYATDELRASGLAFTTGYPIRPEVIPGHLKAGWKIAFQLPTFIRPLKANSLLRQRGASALTPIVNVALKVLNAFANFFSRKRSYRVSEQEPRETCATIDYASFLDAWLDKQPIGLVKDAAFMEWRLSAPGTSYRAIVARDRANAIVGMAVVRLTELRSVPAIAVLDIMITGEDEPAIFSALMARITRLAERASAEVIATMMSHYWAKRYRAWAAGFIPTPAVFSFIIKSLAWEREGSMLLQEANWHVMWIDSDDL